MLSKEEFLKDSDLKREPVEIEGLGPVLMREASFGERFAAKRTYAALLDGVPEDEHDIVLSLALVASVLCLEDGSPMFTEAEIPQAVAVLRKKAVRTLEALQTAFARMNGVSDEDIERAVGNSSEIPSGSSSSGSPGISATQPSVSSQPT